jgi:predicted ATPase
MIVLLDNCEHVLDGARSAVATLTDGSAHVHVLCTTQRRLGLAIEEVVPVEPLGSSAPELFRLRATAADPAFEFDAATRTTVERICESVDGLPLAIELAASRCRTMSVEEIADRLGEPLRLLRSRDGAARHRTLENAIAWSVGLLDPADRELLISLAVFPSSFTWNAAGSVAQLDEFDVVDRLSELLDRSLVTRIDVTYRLLDSVRAFCNAQLDERGDRPIVLERHAAWLRQAVPVPIDGLDTDAVANRLTAAADLIEDAWVALGTLIDRAPEQAALLVLDFTDLWVAYSRADEAIAWLERCLPLDVTHTTRMSVLGWLSGFSWLAGNNDDVERYARTALTEATQAGRPLPGYAATRLALREAFTADPQVSIEHARLAEQAARREPDNASRLLSVIAVIHAIHGDLDTAIRLGDEAIAMSRNEGVLRLGTCLMNRLLVSQGDPSGLPIADEMIGLTERLGRIGGRGQAIFARVLSQRAVGDDAGLLVSLSRALQAFADDHQPVHIASVIDLLPAPLMRVSPRSSALFFGAGRRNETDLGQRSPLVSDDDLERIEAELRHRLGDAEFEQTCAMGAAMSNEEAVDAVRWLTGSSHQSIEAAG